MDRPVAIVTGGSSGIGLETARLLIEHGHHVVVAARNPERLRAAQDELGEHCDARELDVADENAVRGLVLGVAQRVGLDVLVNNAGLAPLMPLDQMSPELLRQVFEVNALAPAVAIHSAWPVFQKQARGCIVNISSVATQDPFPGFFAYAAAKASTNLMAQSAASEGADSNIRAFTVAPGAVETPMLRAIADESMVPPEACLAPIDVARVVVDCVLGERDRDNGKVIWLSNQG